MHAASTALASSTESSTIVCKPVASDLRLTWTEDPAQLSTLLWQAQRHHTGQFGALGGT